MVVMTDLIVQDALSAAERATIVAALVPEVFNVIPQDFATHCVFSAHVVATALTHLDVSVRIIPCQIMCGTGDRSYIVGFVGAPPEVGKWDGHVVVRTGNQLIDCATRLFRKSFGLDLPSVVATECLMMPSNLIARATIGQARIGWLVPPPDCDTTPPPPPQDMVELYSIQLAKRVRAKLDAILTHGIGPHNPPGLKSAPS